jgi:hypothetical protein
MTRRLLLVVLVCAGFFGVTATAYADPSPPPKCFQENAAGDLPTCTYDGNSWKVSYNGDGFGDSGFGSGGADGGGGIPAGFIVFVIFAVMAGIGVTIWRVSMARGRARQAGMDPNQATAVTLLGNDGLDAAYLAANLRSRPANPAEPAKPSVSDSPARTAADRLGGLQRLRDQGLVTTAEYEAQRKAIVGSV